MTTTVQEQTQSEYRDLPIDWLAESRTNPARRSTKMGCRNWPLLCPGTKAASSIDHFVAESTQSGIAESGACSEGHITDQPGPTPTMKFEAECVSTPIILTFALTCVTVLL
jgi:hypothetical protein